jgi:hypothetical protein
MFGWQILLANRINQAIIPKPYRDNEYREDEYDEQFLPNCSQKYFHEVNLRPLKKN